MSFNQLLSDGIFFLIIVGVPSSFFGMVDPDWLYVAGFFDIKMILILFCALLTVIMIRKWRVLFQVPAGRWIVVAAVYVVLQYILTASLRGHYETFKVFRYYCMPLVAIGPLIYILTLSTDRQLRLLKWGFVITVVQGFFYILHHAGFSVFYTAPIEIIGSGSQMIQRFNYAFPMFTSLALTASLIFVFFERRYLFALVLILFLFVIMLYATRALIIQAIFMSVVISSLSIYKQRALGRIGMIILFIVLGGVAFAFFFPQYPEFIAGRMMEFSGAEGLRGAANYNYRMHVLDVSIENMDNLKDALIGHGYGHYFLSEWLRGSLYDELSMQTDVPIAGILYTEGVVGAFVRAVPLLILLVIHIRYFVASKNNTDTMISAVIIVMLAATGVTWLQTETLRNLPFSILPYFLLHSLHSGAAYESVQSASEVFYKNPKVRTT